MHLLSNIINQANQKLRVMASQNVLSGETLGTGIVLEFFSAFIAETALSRHIIPKPLEL